MDFVVVVRDGHHGRTVHRPGRGDAPGQSARVEADAVLASEAGVAVGIRVADCVPVLVGDPETGRAVAVHAGWRGVVAGVVAEAVAALEAPDRGGLVAAVGPCIGPCCFEVGDEVARVLTVAELLPLGFTGAVLAESVAAAAKPSPRKA